MLSLKHEMITKFAGAVKEGENTMREQVAKCRASGAESLLANAGQTQSATWNDSSQAYPKNICVAELVVAQANATPKQWAH